MREIKWTPNGWEDYLWWQEMDRQTLKKINKLIKELQRALYDGSGKPEPLKFEYAGYWSRRITKEHRLVYGVEENTIKIISCRYHY